MSKSKVIGKLLSKSELGLKGIEPFHFELDGGGRNLIEDIISGLPEDAVMLQVGCFLNGSCRRWLEHSPTLRLIGIDPWQPEDFSATFVRQYRGHPNYPSVFARIGDDKDIDRFIASLDENGHFKSALANMLPYRDRFYFLRGFSPAELHNAKQAGVEPSLIYIDAGKNSVDLEEAFALWPNAIFSGDDYTWGADQGYPMKTAVDNFARNNGMVVFAERATWILQ